MGISDSGFASWRPLKLKQRLWLDLGYWGWVQWRAFSHFPSHGRSESFFLSLFQFVDLGSFVRTCWVSSHFWLLLVLSKRTCPCFWTERTLIYSVNISLNIISHHSCRLAGRHSTHLFSDFWYANFMPTWISSILFHHQGRIARRWPCTTTFCHHRWPACSCAWEVDERWLEGHDFCHWISIDPC